MGNESQKQDFGLIQRINEGDMEAFRQLAEKYKEVSFSLACSILKDRDTAEDALQDAFIKVYQKIHTFKYRSSFATWLYRIVVNTSYNALKKQRGAMTIDAMGQELAIGPEATGTITEEDQKRYIKLALERLRPDESLMLRLFYLCEMGVAEIAKITGFGRAKIKVDLHRGRANLHFHLKQLLGDEINQLL